MEGEINESYWLINWNLMYFAQQWWWWCQFRMVIRRYRWMEFIRFIWWTWSTQPTSCTIDCILWTSQSRSPIIWCCMCVWEQNPCANPNKNWQQTKKDKQTNNKNSCTSTISKFYSILLEWINERDDKFIQKKRKLLKTGTDFFSTSSSSLVVIRNMFKLFNLFAIYF